MERRKIYEETLQCGYRRCCPKLTILDDGSVELSDDDVEAGSVGTIKLHPEAAIQLLETLLAHKK